MLSISHIQEKRKAIHGVIVQCDVLVTQFCHPGEQKWLNLTDILLH